MQALNIGSSIEGFSDLFPIFTTVKSYCLCKFFVFDLGPMTFDLKGIMVLGCLVLGWTSFVQVRIEHLVSDQLLLCFTIR